MTRDLLGLCCTILTVLIQFTVYGLYKLYSTVNTIDCTVVAGDLLQYCQVMVYSEPRFHRRLDDTKTIAISFQLWFPTTVFTFTFKAGLDQIHKSFPKCQCLWIPSYLQDCRMVDKLDLSGPAN